MQGYLNSKLILGLVALALIVLAAYATVIAQGEFIWDDDFYVTENEELRDLEGLVRLWTEPSSIPQYYPITHTTFWIEFQLWGENPQGYRLVNVFLHIMNAMALYLVLKKLGLKGALMASVLFAVHPIQAESVAWITERKNVLSLLFFLLALGKLLDWEKSSGNSSKSFGYAFLLFVLALLAKSVTATLPALFLVVCWAKRRPLGKPLKAMLPFFVLAILAALVTSKIEATHVGASGEEWRLPFGEQLLHASQIPFFYFQKIVWPDNLCFNYPKWQLGNGIWDYRFWIAGSVLALSCFLLRARWGRTVPACLLIFLGMLFPALGFINVYPMRYSFVADHFSYHATIAVFSLLGVGFATVWQSRSTATGRLIFSAIVLGLAAKTHFHSQTLQSNEHLWQNTLLVNPESWMAHNNLAHERLLQEDFEASLRHAEAALKIRPDLSEIWTSYALALEKTGEGARALEAFEKSAHLNPDDAKARYNLGLAYFRRQKFSQSTVEYRAATRLQPDSREALTGLGLSLLSRKQIEEAGDILIPLAEGPDARAEDLLNLAAFKSATGAKDVVSSLLLRATQLDSEFKPAWRELCFIYFKNRQWNEAADAARKGRGAERDLRLDAIESFLLATKKGATLDDCFRAVELGQRAVKGYNYQNLQAVDSVSAAYAANDSFEAAIFLLRKGIDLAKKQGLDLWLTKFHARLDLYRKGQRLKLY